MRWMLLPQCPAWPGNSIVRWWAVLLCIYLFSSECVSFCAAETATVVVPVQCSAVSCLETMRRDPSLRCASINQTFQLWTLPTKSSLVSHDASMIVIIYEDVLLLACNENIMKLANTHPRVLVRVRGSPYQGTVLPPSKVLSTLVPRSGFAIYLCLHYKCQVVMQSHNRIACVLPAYQQHQQCREEYEGCFLCSYVCHRIIRYSKFSYPQS